MVFESILYHRIDQNNTLLVVLTFCSGDCLKVYHPSFYYTSTFIFYR